MCGRTACTLEPNVIQNACTYVDPKTGVYVKPVWREHPDSKGIDGGSEDSIVAPTRFRYFPNANLTPTSFSPVLFCTTLDAASEERCRVLQPMMWSLIPPWHKGEAKSHKYSTNNCRIEHLPDSKLFKRAVAHRNYCVVVAQGFYEWKTIKTDAKKPIKQPYFIVRSQEKDGFSPDDVVDDSKWEAATWSESSGWDGPKLLMMAGIYDVWQDSEGKPVYSYSVITMDAEKKFSWIHERMPAILETEEDVDAWLNPPKDHTVREILAKLKHSTALEWYTVSPKVNNSRCHDMDCYKRVEKIPDVKPKTMLTSWLKTQPRNEGVSPIKDAKAHHLTSPKKEKDTADGEAEHPTVRRSPRKQRRSPSETNEKNPKKIRIEKNS